ncbi:glucosaminidase domain-containing protein [Micromonospora sp. NPDC047738]|uniref:glucosaminidase domain-containing protein n=1 Tax=Micromonospora sp. NPDC047738 TaxID=3155741 RepID=UPI0033DF13A4
MFAPLVQPPEGEQAGRWPLRNDVFARIDEREEYASAEPESAGHSPTVEPVSELESEDHALEPDLADLTPEPVDYRPEPELADYGPEPELADYGPEPELADIAAEQTGPLTEDTPAEESTLTVQVLPGRLVVERHPMLAAHVGKPPDLIVKWNAMTEPSTVDVVVHLHGYSSRGRAMNLVRDKEPISGLDFQDPAGSGSPGRTSPTVMVLPRGHYFGGRSGMGYSFPALTKPGAIQALINDALARFTAETGASVTTGRLILTAHSGGGAPLMAILKHTDPDEVVTFDALYTNPAPLIEWARRRIARGSGSLRVIYRAGEGTAAHSEQVHRAIRGSAPDTFRVERTRVGHNDIPQRYGWRLLADPAARLPDTSAPRTQNEAEDEEYFGSTGWRFEDVEGEQDELLFEERYGGADEGPTADVMPSDEESGEVETEEWQRDREVAGEFRPGQHEAFPSGLVLTTVSGPTGPDEEHWDPNGTSLPLYDTGPAVRAQRLSANFTVGELVSSGGRTADKARISAELVRCLQAIRDRVGKPIRITSGYRSWAHNVEVYRGRGKTPTHSRHCSGQAADISIADMTGMEIAKAAIDACGDRIGVGIGGSFAHIDVRGRWTRWTYLSKDADRRALAEIDAYRTGRARPTRPTPTPSPPTSPTPATNTTRTPERAAGRVTLGKFSKCAKGEQLGARAIADQWRQLTGRKAGTFNCRLMASGKPSLHGEGRSADLYARAGDPGQRAQADAYVAWLVANAVELQVAVIIWNGRIWYWGRRAEGWRPYPGQNKHTDHIHVDLSWEGALHPSTLFAGPVPGLNGTPAPAPASGSHVATFVREHLPHAKRSQDETGVPWLVTLGQAALESGWGRHAPRNNFFGIKAKASDPESTRQLLRTKEVLRHPNAVFPEIISVTPRPDGRYDYVVKDWFRAYPSPAEAFSAHGAFLRRHKRYAPAFGHVGDPYAFARAVAAAGYATDPSYASVLTSVMRTIEKEVERGVR